MKLFKKVRVSMNYRNTDEAVEKFAGYLFDDETLVAYCSKENARVLFTTKRIILQKGKEESPKSTFYYSYRNVSAYGVAKNKLVLAMVNSPEYSSFTLRIRPFKSENKENPQLDPGYYDADEKMSELCRALGDLIW